MMAPSLTAIFGRKLARYPATAVHWQSWERVGEHFNLKCNHWMSLCILTALTFWKNEKAKQLNDGASPGKHKILRSCCWRTSKSLQCIDTQS